MAKRKTPGPAKEKKGHNSSKAKDLGSKELTEAEKRELFLKDLASYQKSLGHKKAADADLLAVGKRIKADGFTLAQIKTAIELDDPEGEVAVRQRVLNTLQAARWVGSDVGEQMEMFSEPSRTPIVYRAYEEGQRAAMENKPAKPQFEPHTAAYRGYMKGFHDHTAKLVAENITSGAIVTEGIKAEA